MAMTLVELITKLEKKLEIPGYVCIEANLTGKPFRETRKYKASDSLPVIIVEYEMHNSGPTVTIYGTSSLLNNLLKVTS